MTSIPLARLLAASLRCLVDEMHERLAAAGHPGLRPAHGFALNAIAAGDLTASELAMSLGMTKQGAAKLVAGLSDLGYVSISAHPSDGRARQVALTDRGRDALERAASIQSDLEGQLADEVGAGDVLTMRRCLDALVTQHTDDDSPAVPLRPSW
jgi:DNA-binding MarR family transcriptional regulator